MDRVVHVVGLGWSCVGFSGVQIRMHLDGSLTNKSNYKQKSKYGAMIAFGALAACSGSLRSLACFYSRCLGASHFKQLLVQLMLAI